MIHRLTKLKLREGVYRVLSDGKPTALTIEKGQAPKYGMPQEWDVMHGETYLCFGKGLGHTLAMIQTIVANCEEPG